MRSIPLKTFDYALPNAAPIRMTYADLMRAILVSAPPGQGVSTADGMRGIEVGLKIGTAVTAGLQRVMLEEDDYAFLRGKLEAFRWSMFNEQIAEFIRDVRDAETVDINAVVENV